MFIDARRISDGSIIEAEICVIGGGAAGITLGRELSGKGFRVCLLESGGLRMQRQTQQLCEGETVGIPYELDTTRSRYFGGSTNCWGGFSRPFEQFHFAKRDWVPESGWPISHGDLQPFYGRAHELCGIEATYDWESALASLNDDDVRPLPFASGRLLTSITRLSKERRCFGKAYRGDLGRSDNVTVYLHANATDLQATENAASVKDVGVATFAGNKFRVRARWFILAAGAIENARLLLASTSVEARGLGNSSDCVGRYFMEHPRYKMAEVALSTSTTRISKAYMPRYALLRLPIAAEINIAHAVQKQEGLLDSAAYIDLVLKGEEAASTIAVKELFWDLWRGVRPRNPAKRIAAVLSSPLSLVAFGWGLFVPSESFVESRRITLITEQSPNRDSRITLSRQRDRLGLNKVKLDWRLTDLDRYTARRSAAILSQELERAGILTTTNMLPGDGGDDVLAPTWNWHHMGTTRMHEDAKNGVVDADCRVHGIGNLYIAGSSVFPTAGNHAPTFTILSLALRLADHVQELAAKRPIEFGHDRAPAAQSTLPEARAARDDVNESSESVLQSLAST
jgi:choline dehydrogenase-like flavoprotein